MHTLAAPLGNAHIVVTTPNQTVDETADASTDNKGGNDFKNMFNLVHMLHVIARRRDFCRDDVAIPMFSESCNVTHGVRLPRRSLHSLLAMTLPAYTLL